MIDEKNAIELLHSACKNIAPYWEDHLQFWEDDEPGHYNEMSVFANYVVDAYEKNETEELLEIFGIVEKIIEAGSENARGLAIVGFLESVQNLSSHRTFGPSVFTKWLGKKSAQAWRELNELWEGKTSLADVIRSKKERT